jgi:dipeptidase D
LGFKKIISRKHNANREFGIFFFDFSVMLIIPIFKRKKMNPFDQLQPPAVWNYFGEILRIPRPSKKEEKIIAYLIDFAEHHKLKYKKDETGNILISKPPATGCENKKGVVLQSHLDMVCEKDADKEHDFNSDPIEAYTEKGWVKAKGTTLGADNGIGIAAQLAILEDKSLKHGPLECLFTVDEETGLTGAFNIGPEFFNAEILINLDSEDEGELFIGCAGGIDTLISMPCKIVSGKKNGVAFIINISGLKGGHSGDDINKGRGNSIKLLARFLWEVSKLCKIRIFNLWGGNLRNAIPRESGAGIIVNVEGINPFLSHFDEFRTTIRSEYSDTEPNLDIRMEEAELPEFMLKNNVQKRLVNSLYSCPDGVMEMSRDIPGLVQTSTNLASVGISENNIIEIVTSQRSSKDFSKRNISNQIVSLFELSKSKATKTAGYPGWTPDKNSEILHTSKSAYLELFGKNPVVRAIHAGLECGLFLEKYPGLDMVSFGPTIRDAHSPHEKMDISTVEKFWKLLLKVLEKIPEN